MTEIITDLDTWTESFLPNLNKKLWGFCELAHRTVANADQPTVMTINGTTDRQNVTLDDRYEFITWFRIDRPTDFVDNDEWSFGFKEARFQSQTFRWVIAHRVELGENIIYNIVNSLPESFVIPGYKFVFTSPSGNIDHDHESIYRTELGNTVYEKHRFSWNLYVINLSVEFIVCEPLTSP